MALLLKAAMPLLATASAHAQGKTLVEVCTVYGVSLVPLDGQGQEPAHHRTPSHAGEHCALTALTTLATSQFPSFDAALAARCETAVPQAPRSSQAPDACAAWVARLKHGPPAFP